MTRRQISERPSGAEVAVAVDTADVTRQARAPVPSSQRATSPSEPAIRIERLILHHLDHRAGRCELVDDEAILDEDSARFFANHVVTAREKADWRARFREDDRALPEQLTALLSDSTRFVAASRALAQRLYDFMTLRAGQIVPGDFVVIAYVTEDNGERHVALLKMDPDEQRLTRGFRRVSGRLRVSIEHATNLLPEAKGLQKCALISTSGDARDGARQFTVRLLDTQAGPRSDGVAAFFYRDFLAATLAASARRQTRLFLSETNAWLQRRASGFTPRELLSFYAARRAALAGERVELRPFVEQALPGQPAEADDLLARLTGALFDVDDMDGAMSDHPFFPVDRATAKKYLEKVTIELDGGARLTVPSARFESLVRVMDERDAEGKARLTLASLIFREVSE
ncbi:MAG TPA: nucleoid-associated protein [Ktedonobacterales bacterium]|nr:nucleoid-associated protein [Ktedonobacterales bacterium]